MILRRSGCYINEEKPHLIHRDRMRLSSVYGAGLGHPDAAWGGAGDLLQPLPRVSSDICRRCPSTSAADPLRPLRQTSFDICGKPRTTSAADLGAYLPQRSEHTCRKPRRGLLIPRFYPRFSMNSIARAISSGVSMPMVS